MTPRPPAARKPTYEHVPLIFERLPEDEQRRRVLEFLDRMKSRRSVRAFSPEAVPIDLVERVCRDMNGEKPA